MKTFDLLSKVQNTIDEAKVKYGQINLKYYNAAILSTCASGRVSSRTILVKNITSEGLVFFTNYNSFKSQSISQNNSVSLTFFWEPIGKQIHIYGDCFKISSKESLEYFHSRPYESQIASYFSKQSEKIDSYQKYEKQCKDFYESNKPVPSPDFWGGFIVHPKVIEFWEEKENRMHQREIFEKNVDTWTSYNLYP